MVELRSDPYTLKTRPDVIDSEKEFRDNLNLTQVNGALFNVLALRNSSVLAEYDAVLWRDDRVCFIEYKDSRAAKKRMNAKRAQQISDISRNLARAFGFARYNFTIVAKNIDENVIKGGVNVISLDQLYGFEPEYSLTHVELDYLGTLIEKYSRTENPAELTKEKLIAELNNAKLMITQQI